MQIEVKGRNVSVTDELREHVERRFTKVGKQVSDLVVQVLATPKDVAAKAKALME